MTYTPARVDLGSLVCNTGVPDVDDVRWFCEIPTGWDSAPHRGSPMDISGRDGSVSPDGLFGGRQLVVSGLAIAPSSAVAWDAYYRVVGSLPGVRGEMELVVHEPVPKGLTVTQDAQPKADPPRWGLQFRWQLTLRADYPIKRALTPTTATIAAGGSAAFTNNGNAIAEFEVTTTTAGTVVLTAGGLTLSTYSLPAGSVIKSQPGKRGITGPAGEDLSSSLVPGYQWPAIVPDGNTFDSAGTAGVSLSFYDSY